MYIDRFFEVCIWVFSDGKCINLVGGCKFFYGYLWYDFGGV